MLPPAQRLSLPLPAQRFSLCLPRPVQGFVSCFGIGMLLSFLSTIQLWSANYTGFASLYTIGNIIALLSMGFLMGALPPPPLSLAPVL